MEFQDPLFLLLGLFAPLLLIASMRSASLVRFSSLSIPDAAARSWRVRLSILPAVLLSLASLCFAVALARPRTPDAESRVLREGIAIMAVVDRSGSMNARDLVQDDQSVDRLEVVKDVFGEFVLGGESGGGRPDDMIGLIALAGYADSLCPLTLDHGNLMNVVEDLQIVKRPDEDGTALGDALALAVERLRQSTPVSKVAILLTDGVNNAGVIDPDQAAELATSQGIKVYCIGAGTEGVAPFPTRNPFTGQIEMARARVEIDEETLKRIALATGGRYFRATDKQSLAEIYQEIDLLERTEISETRYLRYTEHYGWFATAALSLLALAALASGTVFRTLP